MQGSRRFGESQAATAERVLREPARPVAGDDADVLPHVSGPQGCPLCGASLRGDQIADALRRARTLIDRGAEGAVERTILALVSEVRRESTYPERLLARRGDLSYFIPVNDIDWIEASRNVVLVHVGAEVHTLRVTTASIEAALNPKDFWRIRRSTMVNVAKIKEVRHHSRFVELTLVDGTRLRTGVRYRQRWREFQQ